MAKCVNLQGKISDHSLRATAASRLYQQNVDEQLVMETTGHNSTCVCNYKCTASEQMRYLSSNLYGNMKGDCDSEIRKCTTKHENDESEPSVKKVCIGDEKSGDKNNCQVSCNQEHLAKSYILKSPPKPTGYATNTLSIQLSIY